MTSEWIYLNEYITDWLEVVSLTQQYGNEMCVYLFD